MNYAMPAGRQELRDIIHDGIEFLISQQQRDVSFLSYSAVDKRSLRLRQKRSFKNSKKLPSIFPTALILSCLNSLGKVDPNDTNKYSNDPNGKGHRLLQPIQKRAAKFLLIAAYLGEGDGK